MVDDIDKLEAGNKVIDKWWRWVRPYWHVLTFLTILIYMATMKWAVVESYAMTLESHTRRLDALELWQAQESIASAASRQEVHDIHERMLGK